MKSALACAAALLAAGPAFAQSQGPDEPPAPAVEPWRPPTLTIERYNEDWSKLADPANRTGHWTEKFKYIPLTPDGDAYLTTGIEVRLRNENYSGLEWGSAPAPDQGYLWARVMPYADVHVGRLRGFVQPIATYAVGVKPGPSPVDQSRVDLLQGFADYLLPLGGGDTLRLEAGRQLVSLGSERLIGTRYGPNTPLAFDGGRAILHVGQLAASGFYLMPVQAGPDSFDDRTSPSEAVWGVYATRWFGAARPMRLDAYYIGYRNDRGVFEQGAGRELRHTLGLRSSGQSAAVHWNAEAMLQFGHFAGAPIHAWSVAMEAGHQFANARFRPDLTVHLDLISGDHDAADAHLQTFNPLFPKGKYFGELSPVGPYNLIDLHPTLTLDLGSDVQAGIAGMAYWRQSRGDGVYDIPGNLLRRGSGSDARFIGKEIEGTLSWQATAELNLGASASLFTPGAFIRETGPSRDIGMLAVEANFRF